MASVFRIVFKGELVEGFELATVKSEAVRKLKASDAQVDRLFSGKRAILKKGLSDEEASRYASSLERIGMRVILEPDQDAEPAPLPDMEKTMVVNASTAARMISSMAGQDTDKTMIVAPSQVDRVISSLVEDTDKTMIVSPGQVSKVISNLPVDTDKTLIVPPSEVSRVIGEMAPPDMDRTMIVSPSAVSKVITAKAGGYDPHKTQIARFDDGLDAFDPKLPAEEKKSTEKSGNAEEYDPEKTEIANPDLVSNYFDTVPPPEPPVPYTPPAGDAMDETRTMVTCPTCGEIQPRRINCRRCGHELALAGLQQKSAPVAAPAPAPAAPAPAPVPKPEIPQPAAEPASSGWVSKLLVLLGGAAALIGLTWLLYTFLT